MQRAASPVVPCAQLITGQPPAGGVPVGIATVPETATSFPLTAVVWYSTSRLRAAWGRAAAPVSGRDQITAPGLPVGNGLGGA